MRSADPGHPAPRIPELAERLPVLDGASCLDHPYVSPDAWTGGASHRDRMLAKIICTTCPVLSACRAWALGPSGTVMPGIIGGMTEAERRQVRYDRRAAS